MTGTATNRREVFVRAAKLVEANQLSSADWYRSLTSFDLIRWDTPPEVLAFAESVKADDLDWRMLSLTLRLQSEWGGQ